MVAVHTEKHKGLLLEIHIDEDATDPLEEFDSIVKFACLHKRHNLGNMPELTTPGEIAEHIKETRAIAYPLYLMDHSGLTLSMSTTNFASIDPIGWDWGLLGYVFITREDILKERGRKYVTSRVRDWALSCIEGSVSEYGAYVSGEVYGFTVSDPEGEEVDSCWGYYGGLDCVIKSAKEAIDSLLESKKEDT